MIKKTPDTLTTAVISIAAIALLSYGFYKATRPQVAIINFTAVQQKAKAYLSVAEEQKKYDSKVQEIVMKDKEFIQIQAEGKKLNDSKKDISEAEFERKAQALQTRLMKLQEKYRPQLERNAVASQLALKSLEKEIAEAVEATSQKTGAKILLPVNTILYAAKEADVTDTFVKELDKRVQTAQYPNPETLK